MAWWFLSVAVALVHNGLWSTPNLETFAGAAAAFPASPGSAGSPGDYVLATVSTISVAGLLGWTEPHEFARAHLLLVVAGSGAITWLAWRRGGLALARAVSVVLAASPLVTVSLQWLGQPDPLTGGCALAAVLVRRRWAVAALALVAGLTHPEQAVLAFAGVVAVRWAWPPDPDGTEPCTRSGARRVAVDAAAALGSVVVGAVLGRVWIAAAGVTISRSRVEYLEVGLPAFAEHHLTEPVALAWSLLGPLWILVAVLVVGVLAGWWRADGGRRPAWTALGVLVAALPAVFITLDETRVFAVVTASTLAVLGWFLSRVPTRSARGLAAGLLVFTAIVPGVFSTGASTWRGELDSVPFAAFLLDGRLPEDAPPLGLWLLGPVDITIPDLPSAD